MPDLTDIIEQQVRAAEDGTIETPDPVETTEVAVPDTETTETPEVFDTEEVTEETKTVKEPAKEESTDTDEAGTILAAAGIKPPVEGQRENRIPYSRTHKIVENALKKERTAHTTAITAKDAEITPLRAKAQAADNWDRLIATDPDKTMQALARIHPDKYKKYVDGSFSTPATTVPAVSEAGPKPGPDLKYEDGTVGYSPEQFEKREAWLVADATAKAIAANKAEFDKRLSPFEQERRARAAYDERLPVVRAERDRASKAYGKLFTDDEAKGEQSEILKAMREQKLSITEASAVVLIPKLQESQTKMRADILKELKDRSKGVGKSAPGATTATTTRHDPEEERSIEDIIRSEIAASGLK